MEMVGAIGFEPTTPLRPRQQQKVYLIGLSRFYLCPNIRFCMVFGSIWTQVGLKF